MPEWPKSRQLAAQYQTPFYGGLGFARYASTGTVTPELWSDIERIESDAEASPDAPEVKGWAQDMKDLRAALHEEGIPEYVQVLLEWRNDYGMCTDCNELPASYFLPDLIFTDVTDPANPVVRHGQKLCPVCAAMHASHGEKLERLWKDDDDERPIE